MTASVLIIGGSSGIGGALTRHYLASGAQVSVISRQPAPAQPQLTWLQDTLQTEQHSANVIAEALTQQPEIIFICNGVLHDEHAMPEKTIRQLDTDILAARFASNVQVPARYMKLLFGYLCKQPQVKLLALSAKVGSISDNQLGGWYSYRSAKAALNMAVKTAAIELQRQQKNTCLVTVHPGTTDTPLAAPFSKNVPASQLQIPATTALRLWQVADNLQPSDHGALLNWDGSQLPY